MRYGGRSDAPVALTVALASTIGYDAFVSSCGSQSGAALNSWLPSVPNWYPAAFIAARSASPLYSDENGVPSVKSPTSTSHIVPPRAVTSPRILAARAARRAMPPMSRLDGRPASSDPSGTIVG